MKTRILSMAILASMTSGLTYAADTEADIDMSNPTDVYTSIGASYGSEGMNIKGQLMLSEKTADSGQKSGVIFEAKNIFNEGDKSPKFTGMIEHPDYGLVPTFNDETSKRSYRLRYGTINTTNGTGWSIDAILADHPFYGSMAVVQAGPVMTIPVTDNFYIWPILYAGAVVVGDNMQDITATDIPVTSSGIDVPSLILTGMVYARYAFNDNWWMLLSASYTEEMQGKSWSDDIMDGGLQMASFSGELSLAYQMNKRQNVRVNYKTDNSDSTDDSYWIEYNHAF
ncbi:MULTISPECIES: hypothetical protein [unclassified Shewanella]|uniref:hypothetical protein n=1 Tax=unclassified Shewanella TaxID=196818 RepID=UPI000C81FB42|nr:MULTISPECIES: hypothetical protein [unclassified Shewanella]MDO6620993.1 hypothetical protein [Shewanella sp. 6_MG-2023]MDO6641919.1 hypothetical protein [Shewanella sp. 5_MG-2023]MDO6680380.1 hypothetical protein [Shewanella sp. 4_MG-2023]MDO6777394.1 hypothetical protein [Shewanella sp. 3_MG-2023]PMG31311.1 hypothetical protein BCU94_08700 [Shewanella sp. 10N.286.52.C2]